MVADMVGTPQLDLWGLPLCQVCSLLSISHVYVIELRVTTVSVCHICLAHPCLRVSSYMSGLVSVSPSQTCHPRRLPTSMCAAFSMPLLPPSQCHRRCLCTTPTAISLPSPPSVHHYPHPCPMHSPACPSCTALPQHHDIPVHHG